MGLRSRRAVSTSTLNELDSIDHELDLLSRAAGPEMKLVAEFIRQLRLLFRRRPPHSCMLADKPARSAGLFTGKNAGVLNRH
jgi:hypothetical protein